MQNHHTLLFSPLTIADATVKNRIVISPMCTYSCAGDGLATDWHLVHLGKFALGGAAIVCVEATAVEPQGRITYGDLGIWSQAHDDADRRVHQSTRCATRHSNRTRGTQRQHAKALGKHAPIYPDDQLPGEPAWALFDPFWPLHAARQMGADPDFAQWPEAYGWWLVRREALLKQIGHA